MPNTFHVAARAIGSALSGLLLLNCSGLPSTTGRSETRAVSAASGPLKSAASSFNVRYRGQSGIRPIRSGPEALAARVALAAAATRAVDAQYYIWHEDASGRRLACALLRAADRGVRVRLLLDDLGSSAKDENLLLLNRHENIEVRLFNPITNRSAKMLGMLADFGRVNHRMHNKVFVADNQLAVVGGRNIGDEYFAADEAMNFADFDVLAAGPVVGELSQSFDSFWNSPLTINIADLAGVRQAAYDSFERLRHQLEDRVKSAAADARLEGHSKAIASEIRGGLGSFVAARAKAVGDDPGKASGTSKEVKSLAGQVRPVLLGAEKRVILVSPYFVPGNAGVELLAELCRKGVEVIVLTNSLASNDVPLVHAAYRRYRKPLLSAGVRLQEFKSIVPKDSTVASLFESSTAGLHAKTFTFDDRTFYVGSMNLDPRSIRWNTETGVIVDSPELAEELTRKLLGVMESQSYRVELRGKRLVWTGKDEGHAVIWETEPNTSKGLRFKTWLLGLLPLEKHI